MKIGIIGTGNVGSALGRRWTAIGHEVRYGVRNPSAHPGSTLHTTVPQAVASSEIIVLATPWEAVESILATIGNWQGKILIDATNPLSPDLSGLTVGTGTSAGEQVAAWASGARVVKAFNTVGANIMEDSTFAAGKVVLFYCGDDAAAKSTAARLAEELGFNPVDAGPLSSARLMEPLALLWITLAFPLGHGRNIAFQFMHR